jgi:hypothetical protein
MSEAFISAVLLILGGLAVIGVGSYLTLHQKAYYDPKNKAVTQIEIPFFGKLKTNYPAVVFCFAGLMILWLGYSEIHYRDTPLVNFEGEVAIDPDSVKGINAIMVGITSGLWSQTSTPDTSAPNIKVAISVPNSWPSYTAYAFALGGPQTRPAIIGTSLGNPKFKLSIQP